MSRRALLEDRQRTEAAEVRRTIVPGAVITGTVAAVHEFGAFVEFGGGVQGLLHVSDMAWSRVADVSEVARPGETITVKVLRVDAETQKIALGLKQLTGDPWATVDQRYAPGQVRTGRRFANTSSTRRMPNSPASGRCDGGALSNSGSPTAPINVASAFWHSSSVSLGKGPPVL